MLIEDKIVTLNSKGKKGVVLDIAKYRIIKEFIFNCLKQNKVITFQWLIEEAKTRLLNQLNEDQLCWLLVHVKADLQGKGLIQVKWEYGRVQLIRIKSSRWIIPSNQPM